VGSKSDDDDETTDYTFDMNDHELKRIRKSNERLKKRQNEGQPPTQILRPGTDDVQDPLPFFPADNE